MLRSAAIERRQFLKWMGLVGVAAVLGAGAGLREVSSTLTSFAAEPEGSSQADALEAAQPAPTPTAAESLAGTACVVRCRNACSYPGHCKRYVDSNANGRCDCGECM